MRVRWLFGVVLLVAVTVVCPLWQSARAQDDAAAMIAQIEAPQSPDRELGALTLQDVMQRLRVPGLSIAVIRDFKIHWAKAYGVADVETGRPVRDDTLFQAASISKPVVAMAALRLVQEGRFSLDADVNTLLKSWHVPESELTRGHPVTPRSLFSHTSGADDGFGFPGYDPSAPRPTVVQILNGEPPSNVGRVLFTRPPFRAHKYSGGGLTIMQLALTDMVGKPFAEIMRTLILAPLGMTSSSYEQPLPDALGTRAARAHNMQGTRMGPPWHVYPEQAAAGLWTTPGDLARFVIELQHALGGPAGRVLKQATAREMVTPTGVGPFAVGLRVDKRGEGWYVSHGGSNWGFKCALLAHVRNGYGVVVMANGDNGDVRPEIEARVTLAYKWDTLDKPLPR
ncbi:MAG: beta-lactamase family protein [Spirochaetes bacterium]|nr:beta-lactamase family protein [Spirochaetota bacterium]